VTDLVFRDCGFWCIVPTHSTAVRISNCTVDTGGKGPNTDGVEPMWSTDVEITDMYIHNGDDCITVKSGSRNVHVERVRCQSSHGITIGSVWYDDVANVTYRNCTCTDCGAGPRIKGRRQGNGSVSNITFDAIALLNVNQAVQISMDYETPGTHPLGAGVTATNVTITRLSGTAHTPGSLECLADRPCTAIDLSSVRVARPTIGTAPRQRAAVSNIAQKYGWTCSELRATRWVDVEPAPGPDCTGQTAVSIHPQSAGP